MLLADLNAAGKCNCDEVYFKNNSWPEEMQQMCFQGFAMAKEPLISATTHLGN